MDTFLVFLFIFGIAGLGIWGLLHFSQDRYGKYSPIKTARTYQTDWIGYFTNLSHLVSYPFGVLALLFFHILINPPVIQNEQDYWPTILIGIFAALVCLYIFTYHKIFLLHYWRFTKDISFTTSPSDRTIHLNVKGKTFIVNSFDIEKIVYTSNNTKMHFAHYRYFLKNGDTFVLTDRTPDLWVVNEYWKGVPLEFCYKLFPFIK